MSKTLKYAYIILITVLTAGCLTKAPINKDAVTKCCTKMFYEIGYDVTVGVYDDGCIINIVDCHDPSGDLESRAVDLMNTVVSIGTAFKRYNGVKDEYLILIRKNNLVLKTTAGDCNYAFTLHENGQLTPDKLNGIFDIIRLNSREKSNVGSI